MFEYDCVGCFGRRFEVEVVFLKEVKDKEVKLGDWVKANIMKCFHVRCDKRNTFGGQVKEQVKVVLHVSLA